MTDYSGKLSPASRLVGEGLGRQARMPTSPPLQRGLAAESRRLFLDDFFDELDKMGSLLRSAEAFRFLVRLFPLAVFEGRNPF